MYAESANAPTFLEATLYTKNTGVVQVANFIDPPSTDEERAMVNPINRWYDATRHHILPFFHYIYHRVP